MKIFIDARMIYKSGIGRYIREILKNIATLEKDTIFYLAGNSNEIKKFICSNKVFNRRNHIINYDIPIYSLKEPLSGSVLNYRYKKNIDVFFSPHYNVPFYLPENSVITIHDLIHFKFPQYFGSLKVKFAKIVLSNGVKKAKRIIVDSNSTAKDLRSMFPGIENKIEVVNIGVSKSFSVLDNKKVADFKRKNKLNNYILYIGNKKPHKNLKGIAEAYINVKKTFKDLKLVIIGKKFKDLDVRNMFKNKVDLTDVIELENIPDNEIVYYYNGASAFVFPSFYEGFGLPPLEAMACGCPVIVSDTSSLPEICGDGAYYVDPGCVNSITRGIYDILSDEDLQKNLISKGLERTNLFNWEKAAKKTLNIFKELL